jgi:hypothetical protein
MKQFNDFHLYLNSLCRHSYVEQPDQFVMWYKLTPERFAKLDDLSVAKVQLQLRPLSSMTEEEAIEYFEVCSLKIGDYIGSGPDWVPISARSTKHLLSKGFDLFNLIPEGLAIEKK